MTTARLGAFAHATIGTANLGDALAFWRDALGFEVRQRRDGPDAALTTLWGLDAHDIAGQAIVATPGAAAGALHLVEFAHPGPPVREGARPYDHLPKNLDVYVDDIDRRMAELEARGLEFRTRPVTAPGPGGLTFREVHLPGHDGINVVLLQVIGPGYATRFGARGCAGIGPLVTIVGDVAAEAEFYRTVLGMDETLHTRLRDPALEAMLGLPPGAALDLRVYGDAAEPLGRIEVIAYERTAGSDRYGRARPPARGTLHANYRVPDLRGLRARLRRAGTPVTEHGELELIYGAGPVLSCRSPAGFRLEIQEDRGR